MFQCRLILETIHLTSSNEDETQKFSKALSLDEKSFFHPEHTSLDQVSSFHLSYSASICM